MSRRQAAWAAALSIIVGAWLVLFAPQLGGRVFVLGDATAFRPFSDFSRERWFARHERTHWNPYAFGGYPANASLNDSRPQYLPDALLDAWETPGRWPAWPPLLPVILVQLAGMLAAGALARALWRAGPAGFSAAALAYGLAPNVALPAAYGHDAQLIAVAALPIPLLAAHGLAAAATRRGALAAATGLAAALGALGLTGHPQYVAYAGALTLAFGAERLVHHRRPGRAFVFVAAMVVGAVGSAAVWLPAKLYSAHSVRAAAGGGVGLAETAQWSLGPRDAVGFVWPWGAGFGGDSYWGDLRFTAWPQYLGVSVLALAALGLARRRRGESAALVFWVAVALVALALSFGVRLGPPYAFLQRTVPFWSLFRVAAGTVALAHLALALLAARGLEDFLEDGAVRRISIPMLVAAACAAGFALVAAMGASPGAALHATYEAAVRAARPAMAKTAASALAGRALGDLAYRAGLLAGLGALLALGAACARARAAIAGLALALVAFDFAPDAVRVLRAAGGPLAALAPPAPAPLALAALADSAPMAAAGSLPPRVLPLDFSSFFSNQWAAWRVPSLGGFHGTAPRAWEELRASNALGSYAVWCELGVRYVAGDASVVADSVLFERAPSARDVPGAQGPASDVARVRGALGRVQAVERVEVQGDDAAVLRALQSPAFDPSRIAYSSDARAGGDFPGSHALTWRWLADEPDRVELALGAPADGFLILADAWFPGWSAVIDGRPVPILRVDHLVRGVRVPAGARRLTFRYEPEGWRMGRALTLGAGALVALAALALAFALALAARDRASSSDGA